MSKNYDQIATVNISIESPIVDDASFDNLLIMGPAPKGEYNAPDVGAYSNLPEVESAGFVCSGDDSDPVGVAARVAFSQSPAPTLIYIAIQKPSASAIAAAETIKAVETVVVAAEAASEMTGCEITYDKAARSFLAELSVPAAEVTGNWMFKALEDVTALGYTVSIDGNVLADESGFVKLDAAKKLAALTAGGEPCVITAEVSDGKNKAVEYRIVVTYPEDAGTAGSDVLAVDPVSRPEDELEAPAATISRALGMSGWYVLCTAGVDPALYEDIAAYIETQEKMFCYTEMGFFGAGDSGENKPSVGSVYYRTMGIYGRENTKQVDSDVPDANWYMNVAWVAKWLNYTSGSETAAFKILSAVYPSNLSSTEMKLLAEANLNYFITVGNRNISMNGKVAADEWADVIRFRDWLKNDMQVRVVNVFIVKPKIPFTDSGIGLIQNVMIASLKAGQDAGGIAETEYDEDGNAIPGFTTSVPLAYSLTASEKASRKLTKCKFKARLAGAIHVAELDGSLTYEL